MNGSTEIFVYFQNGILLDHFKNRNKSQTGWGNWTLLESHFCPGELTTYCSPWPGHCLTQGSKCSLIMEKEDVLNILIIHPFTSHTRWPLKPLPHSWISFSIYWAPFLSLIHSNVWWFQVVASAHGFAKNKKTKHKTNKQTETMKKTFKIALPESSLNWPPPAAPWSYQQNLDTFSGNQMLSISH